MKKILMLSLMAASAIMADPLVSYPGTKAKGMGGAFTAIANNNSAMYFNPAGMVNFDSNRSNIMFTGEVGTGAAFDFDVNSRDDLTSSTVNYFVAFGMTTPKFGLGLAVYSLYSVRADAVSENGEDVGYKDQDISALSVSGAYTLTDKLYPGGGRISVGATLGLAFSGGGLIEIETTDSDGTTSSNYEDDTLDQLGYFGAVGIKARLFDSMLFKVDLGANYRSSAELENEDSSTVTTIPVNGMDMPAELAYGIAAIYQTEYGVVTLSADNKTTYYEEATSEENSGLKFRLNDYNTKSVGLDISGPVYQIRAGMYKSEEQDGDNGSYGLDVSGYTAGAGMTFNKSVNLELSVDNKTYEWGDGTDTSEVFASLSVNFAFENK
jgi:hypothetical protein